MRFESTRPRGRALRLILGVAALVVWAGCDGRYDARVSGMVTLDGKPLDRGLVAYYPKNGGPIAYGVIDHEGEYFLMTGRELGIPAGDYAVTVVSNEEPQRRLGEPGPPPPGRRLTAERISDKRTTDLHYTVEPGGNKIDLELMSP